MTDSISQALVAGPIESLRPMLMGTHHMAVAGHYGAAHAAFAKRLAQIVTPVVKASNLLMTNRPSRTTGQSINREVIGQAVHLQ